MLVPHYMLLIRFYYGTASAPNIKTQQGQKLVVERHSNAHVFHSYFYVINDRFHLSTPPFACSSRPNRSGNQLRTVSAIEFGGVVPLTWWLFGFNHIGFVPFALAESLHADHVNAFPSLFFYKADALV